MLNKAKLKNIKLFLTDVDGVLTDGGIYYFDNDHRARRYHMHDGKFNFLEKELGIKSGFCTQENDSNIKFRAKKLKLTKFNIFGSKDKVTDVQKLLDKNGWGFKNLAYVGDDLADIPLLQKAGVSFSVNNAMPKVKAVVDYVAVKNGGEGAVREIIDLILKFRKK